MTETSSQSAQQPLRQGLLMLMAVATGLTVASNYYAQPLLAVIGRQIGLSTTDAGFIVTTAQVSYAIGLLFLVPLGDRLERRNLISGMTALSAMGLAISALATSPAQLLLGTAISGVFSVVAQLLVPLAATLASPKQRGRAVGVVMSGLLLGVLLARTFAGALAALGSWRIVYWAAFVAVGAMAIALWRVLPPGRPAERLGYGALLGSIWTLFREEPAFRLRSALGGLSFCTFAMLWTALTFLLSAPPFDYSPATIGLFGLIGAAGALAANQAGRLADRGHGALATTWALVLLVASWLVLCAGHLSLWLLVIGIVVMDLAIQALQVSNQSVIYKLRPEARGRLTAGYMTAYFIGGSIGSAIAAAAYPRIGWTGVCALATGVSLVALLVWALLREKRARTVRN
ncbi:MFS transporter [Chitinasiproducens palmae]|uniref:Predicted arabinose efflux permease, MFS family n=1 Tax=Chitinasiproducens palmae TaxID=1770053 RepID=A0A1H2PKS9_9BURK|nr:MFS transporter [Chitinasiproducens palmae]SDV46186.1 Predicted arabinose efflux permease, MFS family [Chitinasiproducens palmae]